MNQTERFYRINELLRLHKVVSFASMLSTLGVSRSTLKRDLNYLCERLHQPIAYSRDLGGYQLITPDPADQHPHELPGLWFSPPEIHALLGSKGNAEAAELRRRMPIRPPAMAGAD